MSGQRYSLDETLKVLEQVDNTYASIPPKIMLEVARVADYLAHDGERLLRRKGPGTDFYEARSYREGLDDPRRISPKLSARHARAIVIDNQAETRQPFFFWRKGYGSMEVRYDENRLTKKEYCEVVFLAMARAIAKSGDVVGVAGDHGLRRGNQGVGRMTSHFFDANIVPGEVPEFSERVPRGSKFFIGSDFFPRAGAQHQSDLDRISENFARLSALGFQGHVCMVIDPDELNFNKFKNHVKFTSLSNENDYEVYRAESLKNEYVQVIQNHIRWVENLARAHNFEFTLQSTEKPPLTLVLKLYGFDPEVPVRTPGI